MNNKQPKCSRNPLEDEAIRKTAERELWLSNRGSTFPVEKENKPQHTREMEEYRMNERILMKLAEAKKQKRGFKQTIKDNAWSIGLVPGSLGFAIDQQRKNIKKERATGEKPQTLYERRPGAVAGAVAGGLMSALSLAGLKAPARAYPLTVAGGALGSAAAGALISDPLARWGTKRYYRKKDEKALKNQQRNELLAKRFAEGEILRQAQVRQAEKYLQENPLQKTAAYGDVVRGIGRNIEQRAGRNYMDAFQKFRETTGRADRASFIEANKAVADKLKRARSVGQVTHKYGPHIATGALGLGAAGAVAAGVAGAKAIKNRQQGQEKTAAYGDMIRNLANKMEGGVQKRFMDTFKKSYSSPGSPGNQLLQRASRNMGRAAGANKFVQQNAKALTTGALGLGAAGAVAAGVAGAKAIKNRQRGQEKTASYYAVREMLGLDS